MARRQLLESQIRYCLLFGAVGGLAVYGAVIAPQWWAKALYGWVAASYLLVGAAYGGLGPRILMKRADGTLPLYSVLLHAPFLLLSRMNFGAFRLLTRESAFDEIIPNIVLGRRLVHGDKTAFESLNALAVLDLTSEFTEPAYLRNVRLYCCVPVLDARAPWPEQLRDGVAFLHEAVAKGPVYVHCALGHGRSATVVAAYLLQAGHADSVQAVQDRIREARPGIHLTREQRKALEPFVPASDA